MGFKPEGNSEYEAIKAAYCANGAVIGAANGQVANSDGYLLEGDTINFPDKLEIFKMPVGIRSNMTKEEIEKLPKAQFFLVEVIRKKENDTDPDERVFIPFYPSSLTRKSTVFDIDSNDNPILSTKKRSGAEGTVVNALRSKALMSNDTAWKEVFENKTAKVSKMIDTHTYRYGSTTETKAIHIPTIDYIE